jgi:serine/threonine protein kinase
MSKTRSRQEEEALFDAALNLKSAEARAAFLDQACQGQPAMRQRLERLLAAGQRADDLFRGISSQATLAATTEVRADLAELPSGGSEAAPTAANEGLGARIGPYKLLQKLGEGGCGVVYMAEQQEPVRRRVALKVIKLGMDTRNVVARFEAERQALALMDHPNIAHVLDAGATEAGRPYFVMELVRGIRITEYCDQNHLETSQRLHLFIQVCHAIQHAHQKGVIHRDIKPSNILVTLHDGVPVPKVIDFGIAKATEGRLTDKTVFTAYEHFIGTPAYMSPEQAEMSGLDVDTRSDIYSLGVLLYELLTGRPPFDPRKLAELGPDGVRRTLREQEPQRPSTMVTTLQGEELTAFAEVRRGEMSSLTTLLEGDLDWVVMKALEKDRGRRYQTANALAADLEHYLSHEPVLARPPSRVYRFQKLVRRNRTVFAAAAVTALALLIGLGVSTVLFIKEREARRRAVLAEREQVALRQEADRARDKEAVLRREAEARARVTEAMMLVGQERFREADDRLTGLIPGQPSIESATVFRSLGEWHALHERWGRAADNLRIVLAVNQLDDADKVSLDYCASASVLAELGDRERFEELCGSARSRLAGTANAVVAERVIKLSLLFPPRPGVVDTLRPWAKMALPDAPVSIRTQPVSPGSESGFAGTMSDLQLRDFDTHQPFSFRCQGNQAVITAGGVDIWEARDSFLYAYLQVTNDFDYRMRVLSLARSQGGYFTRAGIMARDSLSNASCHQVTVAVNVADTFQVLTRLRDGSPTTFSQPPNPLPSAFGSNSWVRLQRVGSLFYTYCSSNGVDWIPLHQFDTVPGEDGPFANPIYLGIAVSAYSSKETTTAQVSDFGITPTVSLNTTISLALWEYRRGDYTRAAEWCRRCLGYPEQGAARLAVARAVLAMTCCRQKDIGAAELELAAGRELVATAFKRGVDRANAPGSWSDWVAARVLLREAANLVVSP